MTPLAHAIVKELTLPLKNRSLNDPDEMLARVDDVHCFEVTEVLDVVAELARQYPKHGIRDELMFLPAPRTWIEHQTDFGYFGILIEDVGAEEWATWRAWGQPKRLGKAERWIDVGRKQERLRPLPSPSKPRLHAAALQLNSIFQQNAAELHGCEWIRAVLAIINTPRIIGRTTHMPHAGLQKRLARARGLVGRFPLHAWTEIKLKVCPPKVETGDDEIWLTGHRALHFVRCHLRIRLGQLELVSAHWRGDPALGIKQSRYKLVA